MTKTSSKLFSFKKWLLVYSVLFFCVGLIIWRPFYQEHKNMIWGYDGLYQTYAAMVYISKYWREFFSNLLSGNFCLPMVDTSIGMGFDILTTLNYYGFGDPLLWLSLLFPTEKMELCYSFLAILRYYLAGLTFGVYCHSMGKQAVWTLGGAFVYLFSGFALYAGVRHPYFMNPWVYFPLLCLGVEQVLQGRKGVLLAITAGISACSNFYFFYMLTILAFLYAVIRFMAVHHRQWRKKFVNVFFAGCGWYLLGIALGAAVLIPDILAIWASARVQSGAAFANTWFAYPLDFYKQLGTGYLLPVYAADYWCILVYPAAAFTGLFVLGNWKKEGENLWLGIWFLIMTLLLWIPLGGLAMNGFSYVSHRWVFGYSFCIALLFVLGMEKVRYIPQKAVIIYTVFFLGAASLFIKDNVLNGGIDWKIPAGFAALFFISMISILLFRCKSLFSYIMVSCVVFTAILSARSLYSNAGVGYTSEFGEFGSAWRKMTWLSEVMVASEMTAASNSSGVASASLIPVSEKEPAFSRIEGDTPQETNWGMISGINGANSYFSLTRKELYDYAYELENPDLKFPSWYNGFGERASLLSLNCVRYFTKMEGGSMAVPYGYIQSQEFKNSDMSGNGILYESPYAMPVGYTYDTVMSSQDLESLPALRKQQAFMQAAVLDEEAILAMEESQAVKPAEASGRLKEKAAGTGEIAGAEITKNELKITENPYKAGNPLQRAGVSGLTFDEASLPFRVVSTEGLTWDQEKGLLHVGESGGKITVQYQELDNSETYLRVCGFDIEESGYEMLHFFVGAEGNQEKKIYCTSNVSAWNGKLKNFLVLVGSGTATDDGIQTAQIRFPFSGTFRLDNLEMYTLPMDSFTEQALARKKECLNATLSLNQIKGRIQVAGNRILCISIPYSEGWSAKVDGQRVPVWKCNRMHLGILLEEGDHEILFSYRTPGLAAGVVISLLSLFLLIGICLWKPKDVAK